MQLNYEKVSSCLLLLLLIAGNYCCIDVKKSWAEELQLQIRPSAEQPPPVPSSVLTTEESDSGEELRLQVRPTKEFPPISPVKPTAQFKPIGYLNSNFGYFQTSNVFSASNSPIQDSLAFTGLTLGSADISLGNKIFANISIDGNLIRYFHQSTYDYNQFAFNLNIYRQLSPQMYAAISASNQQLFYVNNSSTFDAGDRFLNENSFTLSIGRRDSLTKKLVLDNLYAFSAKFDDPGSRSRLVNYFLISLSYYLQKPLQIGLDYEFNLADFTQENREDQYNRIFGHLTYNLSKTSNMNLQAGVSLGGSNDSSIDYNGWFLSLNYNLQIGQF